MDRRSSSPYFTYALIFTLLASVFSTALTLQTTYGSHSDIEVEVEDIEYDREEIVDISGSVDGGDEGDNVDVTVEEAGGGSDSVDTELDDNENFETEYEVPSNADDGVYQVIVEFGSEDPVFSFFIVDEDNDEVPTVTDDTYGPGDDIVIEGEVKDPVTGETEVEITVIDSLGEEILASEDVEIDEDDGTFEYDDLTLDDDAPHGKYAVIVEYDGEERGFFIFEVEENGGSGSDSSFVTATLSKTSYKQGETVVVSGEIDDLQPDGEVFIEVEHEDGASIFEDDIEPNTSDHEFEFEFDLDDDVETGEYTVTLYYVDLDDTEELTFVVSSSTSGGGSSSGGSSGSSEGLTARLNKASFLAGETMTITGVVPSIEDEPVNIVILAPDGIFTGSSAFPEPESDKSYSASLRLKSDLEADDDYKAVITYDNKEVSLEFDITGTSSEGPLTVSTDRENYSVGSTVRITGEVDTGELGENQKVLIRVFNPVEEPYRYDLVEPSNDGSYAYSMVVGGDLAKSGEWQVLASYNQEEVETSFQLGTSTGGPSGDNPTFNLRVNDKTYPIEYELSDESGQVEEMIVNYAKKKLVISIDSEEDGELSIVLPRDLIDAAANGTDRDYIVTTRDNAVGDDIVVDFEETQNDDETRTLVIEYEAGTDIIEIAGTTIVPEFGLSAIILAVAIVGVIIVTQRFSNGFSLFRRG